jgi:hypothetical protein
MTNHTGFYLRRDDAAAYVRQKHKISCTAGYLAKLASVGGGPVFHRLHNRWTVYEEKDLDSWALSRISGPMRKASDLPPEHAAGGPIKPAGRPRRPSFRCDNGPAVINLCEDGDA